LGNLGRNVLRGPGLVDTDMSLVKETRIPKISEQFGIQFRAEFFNALNHPNFGLPNVTFGSPAFGTISSINASAPARIIQLALKLYF